MKNSFILFQNYREYFEDLTGDEAKELLFAIFDYEKTRIKPVNLSAKVGCYFLVIKQQLDKQYQEYLEVVKKNRENGLKGGRPKTQQNPKNPVGYLETQKTQANPKNLDNDIDIDIDNGSDNDIDKDNKEKEKDKKEKVAKPHQRNAKFQKPSKEEITDYALQEQLRTDIIEEFMDYYDSNGWRLKGGLPMKDWKATFRRWSRRQYDKPKNKSSGNEFLDMLRKEGADTKIFDNVVDVEGEQI